MNRKKWRECVGMPAYDAMIIAGLKSADAAVIQRLYDYVEADGLHLHEGGALLVPETGYGNLISVYNGMVMPEHTNMSGGATVVLSPRSNLKRYEICRELIKFHYGLSLDCRSMILFFHCSGLSKEHIKL